MKLKKYIEFIKESVEESKKPIWNMSREDIEELFLESTDEALFGRLDNDFKADDLARKLGLMVDEYGVVYGWDGQSFL